MLRYPDRTPETPAQRLARIVDRFAPLLAKPLTDTPGRIVRTDEAVIRLGRSRTTIWRLQREGALPRTMTADALAAYIARETAT